MKITTLSAFTGGWFLGDFEPSLHRQGNFEVCIKRYDQGVREPAHSQIRATEWTAIISGTCRIGQHLLGPDDILEIGPGEIADFEALTDVVLVAVKSPSVPDDKVLA